MGYEDDMMKLGRPLKPEEWLPQFQCQPQQAPEATTTPLYAASSTAQRPINELIGLLRVPYNPIQVNQKSDILRGFFRSKDYDSKWLDGRRYQEGLLENNADYGKLYADDWQTQEQTDFLRRLNQNYPVILFDAYESGLADPLISALPGCAGISVYPSIDDPDVFVRNQPLLVSIFAILRSQDEPPRTAFRQILLRVEPSGEIADVTDPNLLKKHYLLAQLYMMQNRYGMRNHEAELYRKVKFEAVNKAIKIISLTTDVESPQVQHALQVMLGVTQEWKLWPRPSTFGLPSGTKGIEMLSSTAQALILGMVYPKAATEHEKDVEMTAKKAM